MNIKDEFPTLTDRESKVFEMFMVKGLNYAEIGREIGLSRDRARMITLKAVDKVRMYEPVEDEDYKSE